MAAMKKGTKLTDTPKEYMLRVRMDKETEKMLDVLVEKTDLSRSELVRKCISEEYLKAMKQKK